MYTHLYTKQDGLSPVNRDLMPSHPKKGIRTRLLAPTDLCWAQLITAVGQTRYRLMAAHGTTWSTIEDLFLRETGWTHNMVSFSHPTWDPGFS